MANSGEGVFSKSDMCQFQEEFQLSVGNSTKCSFPFGMAIGLVTLEKVTSPSDRVPW